MKTFTFLFFCVLCWKSSAAQQALTAGDSSQKSKGPKVQLLGEVIVSKGYYETDGPEGGNGQFSPITANGQITLVSRSGWLVPVSFNWSSEKFLYRQPYNQIGVSPQYRGWLKMHGGYRNVYFSPLTLAGHSFLGGGVELNPGALRIGAVYGKFNKAIEANFADPDRVPSFSRTGYSVKVGLGNQRDYFDVILLKASDDAGSVSTKNIPLAPAENLVLGISSRLHFGAKTYLEVDAAASAYTNDLRVEEVAAEKIQSPDRELHAQYLQHTQEFFKPRASTQAYSSVQAMLSRRGKFMDIRLKYKRTEPGYKSMGAYYFQTDIEHFLVAPGFKFFKNRLTLQTSVGYQHDNLLNQKRTRTNRLIGSASLALTTKNDASIDLNFSNYGITQKAGYVPLNDTLRLAQNNRTFSVGLTRLWMRGGAVHSVFMTAIYQHLQDLNPFTANYNQSRNLNYLFNYSFQHLASSLDINVGYSYTRTQGFGFFTSFGGPSLTVNRKFFKESKLGILLNISYLRSRENINDLIQKGFVLSNSLGIDYQMTPVHRFALNWGLVKNQGAASFYQNQGTIQYSMSF